jgi:hypothetical protein
VVTSFSGLTFIRTGKGALTITLPQAAPTVGNWANRDDTYSKFVTIKRPVGSTGYDDAWQTSFKSLFNTSGTITLIFEDL